MYAYRGFISEVQSCSQLKSCYDCANLAHALCSPGARCTRMRGTAAVFVSLTHKLLMTWMASMTARIRITALHWSFCAAVDQVTCPKKIKLTRNYKSKLLHPLALLIKRASTLARFSHALRLQGVETIQKTLQKARGASAHIGSWRSSSQRGMRTSQAGGNVLLPDVTVVSHANTRLVSCAMHVVCSLDCLSQEYWTVKRDLKQRDSEWQAEREQLVNMSNAAQEQPSRPHQLPAATQPIQAQASSSSLQSVDVASHSSGRDESTPTQTSDQTGAMKTETQNLRHQIVELQAELASSRNREQQQALAAKIVSETSAGLHRNASIESVDQVGEAIVQSVPTTFPVDHVQKELEHAEREAAEMVRVQLLKDVEQLKAQLREAHARSLASSEIHASQVDERSASKTTELEMKRHALEWQTEAKSAEDKLVAANAQVAELRSLLDVSQREALEQEAASHALHVKLRSEQGDIAQKLSSAENSVQQFQVERREHEGQLKLYTERLVEARSAQQELRESVQQANADLVTARSSLQRRTEQLETIGHSLRDIKRVHVELKAASLIQNTINFPALQKLVLHASMPREQIETVLRTMDCEAAKRLSAVMQERRELQNQVARLKGNIRVICRARPLSRSEREREEQSALTIVSTTDIAVSQTDASSTSTRAARAFTFDRGKGGFENSLALLLFVT